MPQVDDEVYPWLAEVALTQLAERRNGLARVKDRGLIVLAIMAAVASFADLQRIVAMHGAYAFFVPVFFVGSVVSIIYLLFSTRVFYPKATWVLDWRGNQLDLPTSARVMLEQASFVQKDIANSSWKAHRVSLWAVLLSLLTVESLLIMASVDDTTGAVLLTLAATVCTSLAASVVGRRINARRQILSTSVATGEVSLKTMKNSQEMG